MGLYPVFALLLVIAAFFAYLNHRFLHLPDTIGLMALTLFSSLPLFGLPLGFVYCLLFGSLISPTDPVAVLGILTKAGLPKALET